MPRYGFGMPAPPPPPTPHPLGREFQITGALYALQLNTAWHAVTAGMVKPLRVGVSKMCFKGLCALISLIRLQVISKIGNYLLFHTLMQSHTFSFWMRNKTCYFFLVYIFQLFMLYNDQIYMCIITVIFNRAIIDAVTLRVQCIEDYL